jgi:beta-lactamase class A
MKVPKVQGGLRDRQRRLRVNGSWANSDTTNSINAFRHQASLGRQTEVVSTEPTTEWLLRPLLTTTVLSPGSRELLLGWMAASQTGVQRVRAGLPSTWRAGDKAGTGNHGAVNDVIIAWPPNRAPVLAAVYMSESWSFQSTLLSAHRDIGRIIGLRLGMSPSGNG